MALEDIAAGLETTTHQRERGVATVDATEGSLAEGLSAHAEELPCGPDVAAEVVETYVAGASVGEAGRVAGVAPATAAKVLHRLGLEGVCPLAPTARRVVRDWLDARLSRTEALELTGADERAFAVAAYVETHDPLPGARDLVEEQLAPDGDAMVQKRDRLSSAMPDAGDLR